MPVTARLSRRFYDALGDDVANELVDWFDAVDLTYRTDLRELNELNFARFEARMQQGFAEWGPRFDRIERRLDAIEARLGGTDKHLVGTDLKFVQIDARFVQIDARFVQVEARLEQIEARLDQIDARLDQIEARLDQIDARFDQVNREFATIRMEMEAGFGRSRLELAAQRADLVKWMFLFWLGTVAATIAARLI